jgi:hypothetical protein
MKGYLINTKHYGWRVRYEYGKGQSKSISLHYSSRLAVEEFGFEGEEVEFEFRGTPSPRTLNGCVTSAFIINKPK